MVSSPLLQFQIQDIPPDGIAVVGDVPFADLEVTDDELVRCPRPLHFELRVSPVGEDGILVRGRLSTELEMTCDRCLEPVQVPIEESDVCHHLENVVGTVVDLTEDLREDILLVFPQTCLCQDECLGLCPECGKNLNDGACTCRTASAGENPWGALDNLDLTER